MSQKPNKYGWVNLCIQFLPAELAGIKEWAGNMGRSTGRHARIVLVNQMEAWQRRRVQRSIRNRHMEAAIPPEERERIIMEQLEMEG